jgi:hypothetical protein
MIAQFRIIADPRLGPVPQSVNAARRNALEAATTDQLEQARSLDGGRLDPFASAMSAVTASQLTFFPKMILADDTAPKEPPSSTICGGTRPPRNSFDVRQRTAGHPSTSEPPGSRAC